MPHSHGRRAFSCANLYSLGRQGPAALRDYFGAEHDDVGNMPELPAIFPDQMAPVVVAGADGRTLTMMRWGIPGPKAFGEHPVTNVRNTASPHWRPWLKPAYRCLVPVASFSEYADTKPRKTPVWFALDDDRPLFAFAGIWRPGRACAARRRRIRTGSKPTTGCSRS